jgi:ribosomal protein S18 acetylase RimI-like enzyme
MFNAECLSSRINAGAGQIKTCQILSRLTAMSIKLELAAPEDAPAIAALRTAVAKTLTLRHGNGPWSSAGTEKGVLFAMRNSSVYVVRKRNKLIATLTLGTRKPWAIDRKYFSSCQRPLYLTSMAVAPEQQRQGIGRLCVEAAAKAAKQWPGDAIFLDAYDAKAGAGEFYRKCGFREVGRASYRNTPLIYFEMLM